MSKQLKKSISILFIATIVFAACETNDEAPQSDDSGELSQSAQDFLAMRLGMAPATGSPISASFRSMERAQSKAGRMRSDTFPTDTIPGDPIPNDTIPGDTIPTDPVPGDTIPPGDTTVYVSCAEITTKFNHDGSITTTVDYGQGCDVGYPPYTQFLFGRHESTYKNDVTFDGNLLRTSFLSTHTYKNFGGRYSENGQEFEWLNDGTTSEQGVTESDSSISSFQGSFEHKANLTSVWNDIVFAYKGSSFTRYNHTESVVERSDFTYTNKDDYFYSVKVLKPLVTRFDCQPNTDTLLLPTSNVYVSGVELVKYQIGSDKGSFEIHYGNGECDSIVTIVEKGKRKKVDLSQRGQLARKD